MVMIKEYRIPLPLTVEEYRIAQLYTVAKMSKQQTGHGEGVEIKENKPYDDENGKGQYTHKIFHIGSKIPGWIKAILPSSALMVEEKAWNAYPYCKTVLTCPFLGDRFSIAITTKYLPDNGSAENACGLTPDEVKKRVVDIVDIVNDPVDPSKYKETEDPTKFVSEKTGRGKLQSDWRDTHDPIMCSYKHCTVEFRYFGLQTAIESFIHKTGLRDIFVVGHRQAFCNIDEWHGLTIEDIRKIEDATKNDLESLRNDEADGASPRDQTETEK
eukprot:TRINITY_DN16844_c0_g1_i1.p1 TRINITY_DN16844_c0_g1~~TRINITY_DN16844_c0_g1_i1.p1  ORF type:complete len:271 (-),score=67.34 TRINITY_DN16844_c0_g1_i1:76-888(-)